MAEEETSMVTKDDTGKPIPAHLMESRIFNITVRGWLAIILVATVCLSHLTVVISSVVIAISTGNLSTLTNFSVGEPLYSMSVAALGFYFGQQNIRQPQTPTVSK